MLLSDYITQVQFLVHDQTNADFSTAELTNAINNARTVVAEDFQCCRATYLAAPNNAPNLAAYNPVSVIPNQELYPLIGINGLNGIVVGANLSNGGTGYSPATTVTFATGPAGSVRATGVPVITAGVITQINMTAWGTGYPPNGNLGNSQSVTGTAAGAGGVVRLQMASTAGFTTTNTVAVTGIVGTVEANGTWVINVIDTTHIDLVGTVFANAWVSGGTVTDKSTVSIVIADTGGGTGAAATATMFNNVFNVIQISYLWGNQRYTLLWRGAMLFQAYMRSQQFFTQRGMVWTINQQVGYVQIQPPPDQPYVTEWDTICLPMPLLNPGDADLQILPVYAEPVQYYAAHICLLKLQNFEQAEFMLKLYSARVPKTIISTGGVRIPNPYNKAFQRRVSR